MNKHEQIADAVTNQYTMLIAHRERLKEKTDRYQKNTIPWSFCVMEGLVNQDKLDMLKALSEGKTIQPS